MEAIVGGTLALNSVPLNVVSCKLAPRLASAGAPCSSCQYHYCCCRCALLPASLLTCATTGAAPVPVPPPMPAVTNTRSAPDTNCTSTAATAIQRSRGLSS
eukprot:GHUV01051564.1.p1 GENE.GHUV01051564.1~~GHUV01051564.1.p1  ORF type:complete len:101 (+),score=23.99 GHUV01051564.1:251-553(+)